MLSVVSEILSVTGTAICLYMRQPATKKIKKVEKIKKGHSGGQDIWLGGNWN